MRTNAPPLSLRLARLGLVVFGVLTTMAMLSSFTPAGEKVVTKEVRKVRLVPGPGEEPITIDISDLDVCETREFTTQEGKKIVVTREESGLKVDAGGKQIVISGPEVGEGHKLMIFDEDSEDGAFGYHVGGGPGRVMVWKGDADADDVLISGLGDLSEREQQRIIDALRSAGVEKEVHFLGAHDVEAKVIVIRSDTGKIKERTTK